MSGNGLDFEGLARTLASRSRELLPSWLPGGVVKGNEFQCGSVRGEQGQSLRVNMISGKWADFATGDKGGDLISLYACIHDVSQGEAAKQLAGQVSHQLVTHDKSKAGPGLGPPPMEAALPPISDGSLHWVYRDPAGDPLFYVERYDPPGERKQFRPWSWSAFEAKWVAKAYPAPRPLYGLECLAQYPERPILIVEGEKTCEAIRGVVGHVYNVVTWSGGSQAWNKTDWAPVMKFSKVLIWPDADEPGSRAGLSIAQLLHTHVSEIKIIQLDNNDGWDAADAVVTGMNSYKKFAEFAKPLAKNYADLIKSQAVPGTTSPSADVTPIEFEQPLTPTSLCAEYGLTSTESGPICNVDNPLKLLRGLKIFRNLFWFDEFHQKIFTEWRSGKIREWADVDTINLTIFFQRSCGLLRISDDHVRKSVLSHAYANRRNEPKDWMESLKWDGESRVAMFFAAYLGAKNTEYTMAASRNWWISMAARIYQPGCKVDNMVILEGGQGKFKSTALAAVGGPWFTEANEAITTKDFYLALQGKLIIEIAELDSFSRAETNTIKKVVTTQRDRFRPPYGRATQDFPRQCVFVGTTNEDQYLRDSTGGRRFWPIKIGAINMPLITQDRDQLFAESVALFKQGVKWWEMPAEETREEQEKRYQSDEWETIISDHVDKIHESGRREEYRIQDIAADALKVDFDKLDKATQMRIGKAMTRIGWYRLKARRSGKSQWIWKPKNPDQMELTHE